MPPAARRIRRSLLAPLLVLGVASPLALARDAAPPNVLLIVADDLGARLGSYGEPAARTPHLDRLAAESVRFDRAYCQFPLCGPSRASFLTGRYPAQIGVRDNLERFREKHPALVTLPQFFRQHGWFTARVGKLYHQGVPGGIGQPGVDDPASWDLALNPRGAEKDEEQELINPTGGSIGSVPNWGASRHGDLEHTDGLVASETIRLLREHRDGPFFLAAGFYRPHTPYTAPRAWFENFPPAATLPVRLDPPEERAGRPDAAWNPTQPHYGLPDATLREAARAYHVATAYMDSNVGRILAALDELGLRERTIVVFLSDHGYHLGEHGNWVKRSLFEESTRVPLLIRAPEHRSGSAPTSASAERALAPAPRPAVVSAPVELVDLYPTLAALAGLAAPPDLPGQNLAPLLTLEGDAPSSPRSTPAASLPVLAQSLPLSPPSAAPALPAILLDRAAFTEVIRYGDQRWFGRSLRTARWRYTEWDFGRRGVELYDHATDPEEHHNLADVPSYAATRATLAARLAAHVAATEPAASR